MLRFSASIRRFSAKPLPTFRYQDLFQQSPDTTTEYRKITSDHVSVAKGAVKGKDLLFVEPEGLRLLAETAMVDIAHLLRPTHLQSLKNILDDPEASPNDK